MSTFIIILITVLSAIRNFFIIVFYQCRVLVSVVFAVVCIVLFVLWKKGRLKKWKRVAAVVLALYTVTVWTTEIYYVAIRKDTAPLFTKEQQLDNFCAYLFAHEPEELTTPDTAYFLNAGYLRTKYDDEESARQAYMEKLQKVQDLPETLSVERDGYCAFAEPIRYEYFRAPVHLATWSMENAYVTVLRGNEVLVYGVHMYFGVRLPFILHAF